MNEPFHLANSDVRDVHLRKRSERLKRSGAEDD